MFKTKIAAFILIFCLLFVLVSCRRPEEPGTLPVPEETTTTQQLTTGTDASGNPVTTAKTTESKTKATTEPTTEAPLHDYPFEPASTGIYVTRDGEIKSAEITSFDNSQFKKARYDEAGLKKFVTQSIKEFNESKKSEAVTLEELKIEDKEARLIMSYASFNYFLEFQGSDFNVKHLALMSRENAVRNYNISNLVDVHEEPAELLIALGNANAKVLVITGQTLITVNGDILYYSSGMVMTGPNTIRCDDEINYSFVVFR